MTTRILAAVRGGAVALAAGLLTATAGLGAGVLPAAAHTSLVSSTPEDGATLAEPPAEVVLEFDDDVLAEFTQVAVLDQDDGNHEQGDPEIDGGRVTQAVGPLEPGEYRVSYRVGSSDGHPVSGVITFNVTEVPATAEEGGPATGPPETDAPADAADESAAEQAASTPAAESAATGDDGVMPLGIVGAAAAVVAAAAVAFLLTRRRGDGSGPAQEPER